MRDRIHGLWDELATFDAADHEEALLCLLAGVSDVIDAQNAVWIGMVRMTPARGDPYRGWRPRAVRYLNPNPTDTAFARQSVRRLGAGAHDEYMVAQTRLAGRFRAMLQRDVMPASWFSSEDCQRSYADRGIIDALTVSTPVTRETESAFVFHRRQPHRAFTARDRDTAAYALRGLRWFHKQILLGHGLVAARRPLSPTQRRVLALLLTDRGERELAAELGVTPSTAHTYVRDIFRLFGVRSRAGLTALWLGRGL